VRALDTNVLVRYLVEDDREQSERAATLIDGALDTGEPLFVPQLVLAELVWVLTRAYEFRRAEVADLLRRLAHAKQLFIEDIDDVHRALDAYARGKADFADYLIREKAHRAGCEGLVTFDRKLLDEDGFGDE